MTINKFHKRIVILSFRWLLIVGLILAGCKSINFSNSGIVLLTSEQYLGNNSDNSLFPDKKIWYKDSVVIQEIKNVSINSINGVTTIGTDIAEYAFIDRKTKTFYHYRTFSDTASIIMKYRQSDTAQMRGSGGWPFYQTLNYKIISDVKNLPDTFINKIKLSRIKFTVEKDDFKREVIGFLNCDRIDKLLSFKFNFDKKLNCPIVGLDFLPIDTKNPGYRTFIKTLSDSLSKEEEKVFARWQKNLKDFPVID